MGKMAFAIAAAVAVVTASPAFAASPLVTNGTFESFTKASGNTKSSFEFGDSYAGGGTVTGWTSTSKNGTSGYNILFDAATATTTAAQTRFSGAEYLWAAPAGTTGHFVALDGDPTYQGTLSQMVTGLTKGQDYVLTFSWAASQLHSRNQGDANGNLTEYLTYTVNGVSQKTDTKTFAAQSSAPWSTVSYNFKASDTSTLLSFLSTGGPTGQPPFALLDNVSITAVPEPSTWATMMLGFAMVGGAARYRRRKATAIAA